MEEQSILDSRLIEKFEIHRDFTKVFLDAFVLVNKNHDILKFNSAFCQVCEVRAIDVRKLVKFDNFLETKIPGDDKNAIDVLLDLNTPSRIDEVQAKNKTRQKDLTLIMSSYPYFDDNGVLLGSCILLRDVTAENNLQSKYKDKSIESVTDALTGLYMRRYFEDQIQKELIKSKNAQKKPMVAIIMFDLDKFKSVNDTYGHQAGDFVLKETAKLLKANCRRSDILGRYGGEELLVVIFETTGRNATIAAEKFRNAIHSHEFWFEDKKIPVTSSIGVTLIDNNEITKEQAVKTADECLYTAKENGRNVTIVDFGNGKKTAAEYLQSLTTSE